MVGLYLDVIFQNFYIINKIILIFFIKFKWDFFQLKLFKSLFVVSPPPIIQGAMC